MLVQNPIAVWNDYYYGKAYFKGNTDLLTVTIWYVNVFPLSKILRDLFFLPALGSFTTMSEISKSLRGKGIFLLAAIVFSSPGRRVVRATCRTNRETASQIPSKISCFLQVFCFVHLQQEFKSSQVQILHLPLMFKQL